MFPSTKYGDVRRRLRAGEYVSLDEFKSECRFDPYFLEDSLQWAQWPNRHILEYVLSKGVKPTGSSLYNAVRAAKSSGGNMDGLEFLVDMLKNEPNKKNILTNALHRVVNGSDEDDHIPAIKVLIAHGADPNGLGITNAAIICDTLKIAKVLDAHGAVFEDMHVDIALLFGSFEAAYWLYQKGLRGVKEVPYEFLQYKATRDAERDAAARKIYFWILPKLYRNPDFVMRQAERSYDALFGQ
jgi:hypothetical protein